MAGEDGARRVRILEELEGEARRSAYVRTGCQGGFDEGWAAARAWFLLNRTDAMLNRIAELEDDLSELDDQVEAARSELEA